MPDIEFSGDGHKVHKCKGIRDGDWIVFTCSECGFELRDNWRTGKMRTKTGNFNARHSGFFADPMYLDACQRKN